MGEGRSAFSSKMQIMDPTTSAPITIPIVWYFAPPGAKVFKGISAFGRGIEDRDKIITYQLGEQSPLPGRWYDGKNIWGYLGQCRIGTDQQFQFGLQTADLAGPDPAIPACCRTAPPQQVWYLRHELVPRQYPLPNVVVGSNWSNLGGPITAGLLSPKPGSSAEGPTFTFTAPPGHMPQTAFVQYLSAPLPSQVIAAQDWRFTLGRTFASIGSSGVRVTWTVSLIDGSTGLQKAQISTGQPIGQQPIAVSGPHGDAAVRPFLGVTVAAGDYLCLEIGWAAGSVFFPFVSFTLGVIDGGSTPIPNGGSSTTSPMSLLSFPPDQEDDDVPATGTIVPFAGVNTPAGYLLCDGSAYATGAFPALYAVLGTTWGAAGPGTFRVPDARDRTLIGVSPGGLSGNRPTARGLAQVGGEEVNLLDISTMPNHFHSLVQTADDTSDLAALAGMPFPPTNSLLQGQSVPTPMFADTVSTGGGAPHNNMQPFAVVSWLIKT